jgi:prepilin peptidase CpaA
MILGLFPAAMAFAAASDLVSMAISNRLSIALLLGFFVMAAMIGMPLAVGRQRHAYYAGSGFRLRAG